MYNRYIPQADGSFARNRMPESNPHRNQPILSPAPKQNHHQEETPKNPYEPSPIPMQAKPQNNTKGFLKQLLPQGFDTGDLIIILLLLLMAGDCEEDKNNAILTIALYFLM